MMEQEPGRFKRVNKDDLRDMLDGGQWSRTNEKIVLAIRDKIVLESLEKGFDVIVDDTNLHHKHEQRIKQIVGRGVEVEIMDMCDVPLDVCLARNAERTGNRRVPEGVIRQMHAQFISKGISKETLRESRAKSWLLKQQINKRERVEGLPDAIICDLDGTLSLMNGRNPYDASTCDQDLLNEPVADVVRWAKTNGFTVFLFSGRSAEYKEPTLRFLAAYAIPYDHLHMRAQGDSRKDSIVKREMFDAHIDGKYNVAFVLDDRNQVVDVWRKELGLTCFQVDYGNF